MGMLDNVSPAWIEHQYRLWKSAPDSVPEDWRLFFAGFEFGAVTPAPEGAPLTRDDALKHSAVQSLIYRYRDIGHLLACTDPLSPCILEHPLLSLSAFGLDNEDVEKTFHTRRFFKQSATLKEIVQVLRTTYCGSIGVEFMHIQDPDERQWLIDRMEPVGNRSVFTPEQRLRILNKLKQAAIFERTIHKRYPGQTRFSLEGGDVLIPMLDHLVYSCTTLGITDMVVGMAHRGRLNVLANVFNMHYETIFAQFVDNREFGIVGEGDVKYHIGYATELTLPGEKKIHLTLASNPSHLEAINPVVEGKCRARQERLGESGGKRVLPLLIHGDAAFAGQGVVAETLNLSELAGYTTGGTLHIVLNNQIGFTTLPADARSSIYATDVARMVRAPVFHVYGDDPEAVLHAAELALAYRDRYGKDVVVEVICYRRHGHNEGDEPYFTQPVMYEQIKARPPLHAIYEAELLEEGYDEEDLKGMESEINECISLSVEKASGAADERPSWKRDRLVYPKTPAASSVPRETLSRIAQSLSTIPERFSPHPKVAALLQKRLEVVERGEGLDWGTAESLAFGTLLGEGISIRLSGQDVRRGTFSHRHATIFDQKSGVAFNRFERVAAQGAAFRAYDSALAEFAVLGFEYGYSLESPEGLTIWEAQYGDFANGAQVVIDQFIASGEAKWEQPSNLVLMLPHGYEGQGAEHSSARIERFLSLSASDNVQLVTPTTPAQLFHVLRKQMKQSFLKPLVLFTPKSLLRNPLCVSSLDELASGSFQSILADPADPSTIDSVLVCSGKIYYDLLEQKVQGKGEGTALVRIEQLYPYPDEALREVLGRYHRGTAFTWVQEEPRNMGAWNFLRNILADILGSTPRYVGRPETAAPASGSHRMDRLEQGRIVAEALQKP
ncbi:2-oxoglutarate dehydrogenase E1 component [Geomonas sp. RF6]|uniref:2-oxoglutarate dehydrogenase E1 component n=1 Tax=Geomonas sp. RF6 TaxID=2897342 RepID=UPI001E2C9D7B|nr:2-oxoglutarate dehydrogenase E1 component [Geomonas sp. RF6]UFS71505.1 2-oxoglutarate dehydrogenase E1 component [Geomonas sp. RF6]